MFTQETLGLFNPRLLGIHLNQDFPDHVLAHQRMSLDQIQASLPNLPPEERLQVVYVLTTLSHELKHFHDTVGTPFGYSNFSARLDREREFSRVIGKTTRLQVPIVKWADAADCPQEICEFCRDYSIEWLAQADRFDGSSFAAPPGTDPVLTREAVRPLSQPFDHFTLHQKKIQVLNLGNENARKLGIRHAYYPLTALAIMEGAAINVQVVQAFDLFSVEAAQNLFRSLNDDPFRTGMWVYTITDRLSSMIAKGYGWQSNEMLRYQLSDFALTGRCRDGLISSADNPGWRFARLLDFALNKRPPKKTSRRRYSIAKAAELLDNFRERKLKEPPLATILAEQAAMIEMRVNSDSASPVEFGLTNGEKLIREAAVRLARLYHRMLVLRLGSKSFIFAEPLTYLSNITELPFPPNRSFAEGNVFSYPAGLLNPIDLETENDIPMLPDDTFWRLYYVTSLFLEQLNWFGAPRCAFRDWQVPCPAGGTQTLVAKRQENLCICRSAMKVLGLHRIELSMSG
jgi:hypothetical protein